MKIYLDIDDTLINTSRFERRPANHLKEFLTYMLNNHDVYWLTTHCDGDATTAAFYMNKFVDSDITDLIMRIKPTRWKVSKTEAINMDEDFLWFDDTLSDLEEKALVAKGKLGSHIKVDLDENPNILLEFISEIVN